MNTNNNAPMAHATEGSQLERLTRRLIQRAARAAPAALSERLEEEWLAHLAAQRGALARLRFAIGCCWARRVIAHDFLASGAPAAGSATTQGTITLGQYDPNYFSRRTTILLLIVGFHAIVIYGFITGFGGKGHVILSDHTVGEIWDQPPSSPEPLPPPPVSRLPTPPPIVPSMPSQPEFPLEAPRDAGITQTLTPPIQPVAPHKEMRRVLGGPVAAFPNTDDYYPVAARRMGQMGVTTVSVCVDERGRPASAPSIAHSSGWSLLDGAALQLAKAGRYRSTTEDGIPVSSCYPFRIRFQLRQ